jgi:glycosyltransferase involved in cell wall biosynthesis
MSGSQPRVSIIIPSYNHGRFLAQRIRSILDQTFQDFEIIFLDDASTDNTREVFDGFAADPHFSKVIFNETNSGSTFKQWQKGLEYAQGEYVWIAESDDYADPRFLESLVGGLDAHPNVGLAYCQSHVVDEKDDRLGLLWTPVYDDDRSRWEADFVGSGPDECAGRLLKRCCVGNASAVLMRRDTLVRVRGTDSELKQAGDYLLWIRILSVSDMLYLSQPLNYYRRHAASVTSKNTTTGLVVAETYRVVAEAVKLCAPTPVALEEARRILFTQWIDMRHRYRPGFRADITVYLSARKLDSGVAWRIVVHNWSLLRGALGRARRRMGFNWE